MTITSDEINAVAPAVTPKAQEMRGFKSPFISFRSLDSLCQGNETLMEGLHDMVMLSLRYAETVCRFEQIVGRGQRVNEDGQRKEIEVLRASVHDATIASVNSLSRLLKLARKDNRWISPMQDNRAAYAKFSLLIAFEVVLQERKHE